MTVTGAPVACRRRHGSAGSSAHHSGRSIAAELLVAVHDISTVSSMSRTTDGRWLLVTSAPDIDQSISKTDADLSAASAHLPARIVAAAKITAGALAQPVRTPA